MNLQLPPERPLPHADRMVDDILRSEPERPAAPVRRAPWLALAAAAVLAGIVVGVLVNTRGDLGQGPVGLPPTVATTGAASPSAAPTPPSSPTLIPTATPSRTPTRTPSPTARPSTFTDLPLGATAVFTNFEVTVTEVNTYVDRTTALAKTCVRSLPPDPTGQTTRVSIDPWAISFGEVGQPAEAPRSPRASDYPVERFLRVGECVEGLLQFPAAPEGVRPRSVLYENSLGDRATWDARR